MLQGEPGAGMSMSYTRAMVIWCLVGAMAVLTVASFVLTGLTVDLRSNPSLLLSISGILAFSVFYRYWRPNPHLRALTEDRSLDRGAVVRSSYCDSTVYCV